MQRDLSDSSALRNVGVAVAHSGLAVRAARRGLARIDPAADVMAAELDGQWEVLAEAVQTVMRRYGLPQPYERLKELTRGAAIGPAEMATFVRGLGLPPEAEARLLDLTPATYIGLAPELVARLK
jgi:adenylosuccinate lyase